MKREGEEGMEDFGYRNLIVWQKAKTLVKLVYAEVKNLPVEERYALGDQIRRAVVSIPSNIAEGAGRNNDKENLRFCFIAQGSLSELETQLLLSADLNYLKPDHPLFKQITTVQKLLSGYIRHLQLKIRSPK